MPADGTRNRRQARQCLDSSAFTAAWAEGRAMTPEQAVAYALDEQPCGKDRSS
jgi:hypothetical protein